MCVCEREGGDREREVAAFWSLNRCFQLSYYCNVDTNRKNGESLEQDKLSGLISYMVLWKIVTKRCLGPKRRYEAAAERIKPLLLGITQRRTKGTPKWGEKNNHKNPKIHLQHGDLQNQGTNSPNRLQETLNAELWYHPVGEVTIKFWCSGAAVSYKPVIEMSHRCTQASAKTQAATPPSGQNQEPQNNRETPQNAGS